jgi:hypothetical protein
MQKNLNLTSGLLSLILVHPTNPKKNQNIYLYDNYIYLPKSTLDIISCNAFDFLHKFTIYSIFLFDYLIKYREFNKKKRKHYLIKYNVPNLTNKIKDFVFTSLTEYLGTYNKITDKIYIQKIIENNQIHEHNDITYLTIASSEQNLFDQVLINGDYFYFKKRPLLAKPEAAICDILKYDRSDTKNIEVMNENIYIKIKFYYSDNSLFVGLPIQLLMLINVIEIEKIILFNYIIPNIQEIRNDFSKIKTENCFIKIKETEYQIVEYNIKSHQIVNIN